MMSKAKAKVTKTFGQRMTQDRMNKGWTIRDLERKTGIANSMLSSYELDQHEPRLFYLSCIADALEVSMDWLAGRSEVEWLA
jgi:transcriptional regulator with XRE-family HTH domain